MADGWWGERWLSHAIAHLDIPPTEAQVKSAARVPARLRVEKGRVEAWVAAGQRGREEVAVFKVKPLTDREWRRALEQLTEDETVRLLAGQFGPELEAAFARAGVALFPPGALRCSCKEGAECRHIHALVLGAVGLLAENPYLWLEVLGRPRTELQAALQGRVTDQRADGGDIDPDRFWATEEDPDAISVHPGAAGAAPGALLRSLGPLPLPEESTYVEMTVTRTAPQGGRPSLMRLARPVEEVLTEYITYIGEATRALTTGDLPPQYAAEPLPPQYAAEPLPGKPVPLPARLLPEVEAAVRVEGAILSLEQLAQRSPTAGALEPAIRRSALAGALAQLPPDLVTLAKRYVGARTQVLEGAAFRHIITFDEWRLGRFQGDADWSLALAAAGAEAQLPEGLWAELRPETGDELWLTVAGAASPYLQAELLPRRARQPGLDPGALPAVRALVNQLGETGQWGMTEAEAVAVLLAEGHYARREQQDEVWTLPLQVQGLTLARERTLARESERWWPSFGKIPGATGWAGLDGALARTNLSEMGRRCIRWWSDVWPGAQDRPGTMPTLGALLEFLWIKAPRAAEAHGVQPELIPGFLERWFLDLEALYPALEGAYATHLLACRRAELYQHRLLTLPDQRESLAGWVVEGYRWIGSARCWQ